MESVEFLNDEYLTVTSDHDLADIQFRKDAKCFVNLETYIRFIKGIERVVRKSPYYDYYVGELKSIGLDRCQILGNIDDNDGEVDIEMHHGPLLTLFDYCAIVLDYHLNRGDAITSFSIADEVIDEHYAGHVQTVMLAKTPHQLIDTGSMFISFDQAFGNLNAFLEKYRDGLSVEYINTINRFIDLNKDAVSTDNGLLDLCTNMVKWKYRRN